MGQPAGFGLLGLGRKAVMKLLSVLTRKLHTLARFLEQPRLFLLRQRGVPLETYAQLRQAWLRRLRIATVLDIGANTGQFASAVRAAWPEARIYSFEPLPDCYEQLQARLGRAPGFTALNLALGEENGSLTFQRNVWSPSSSFLEMGPVHKTEYPHTVEARPVTVAMRRLDDLAPQLELRRPLLVKIDVQGYEDKVLGGGEQTICQADLLLIESSFEVLYEGQPLFDQIYQRLTGWGFVYKGSLEQACSLQDGRPLQADSIFWRADAGRT